ncbi:MAG TPA: M28 family metallopeptidase [Bryobacteraceae bacterium]|nr:M28 family metallopeptidase [Bryobacteraceae bacterium]
MKQILALLATAATLAAQEPIRGFPQTQWAAEHELEQKALAMPQASREKIYLERMAKVPHHAGSPASNAVAEYALGLFKEFGLDAHIENFEALIPYPTSRALEMVSPVKFRAALKEPAIAQDSYSSNPTQLPTYNAYSGSGDVTAPLVYVNYGIPEDYAYLAKQGIDVKGKIVIARYGRSWRGTKPKVAAEHGAVGCLIYSDPRDDGYYQGDVYPLGPMRPPDGVQRGSVMDMPVSVGDPLSPGWASEPGSKRLKISEAKVLMTIPVMPISYADATPLLKNLTGPVAPDNWRGALGFTYHIGPGPATAHFKLDFDNSTRPLHDVIAKIPGSTYPDEWIIYGNHHDAWVNGANDPLSGASALLETARTLATLRKQGWQPKRTIVLALWDGEEFGLLGSTEWAEKHQEELARKAVVYINSDSNSKGAIGASGSHTLETFMSEVLRDLKDPVSGKSLLETTRARRNRPDAPSEEPQLPGFHLGALGAGSDYVAFLDHLGIASLNLGFGGQNLGGVYHSIYDDPEWFERFADPGFTYGAALSQVTTTTLLRLADAPLLPFEFGEFSKTVNRYVEEIKKLGGTKVDLQPVATQLAKTDADAKAYEAALLGAVSSTDTARLDKANQALYESERSLTSTKGLPGRDWYRHQIYAPGLYTGYGVKTLPGIREAVEGSRWEEANREAQAVAHALEQLNQHIEDATKLLSER